MVTKLVMVEFSTLGKFTTVARVATRRMARPKLVGEMVTKTTDDSSSHQHQDTDSGRILFQLLPKLPLVLKIFCSLAHSSAM